MQNENSRQKGPKKYSTDTDREKDIWKLSQKVAAFYYDDTVKWYNWVNFQAAI